MSEDWCCERNGVGCSCHLDDTTCLQCGDEAGSSPFCSEKCYNLYVNGDHGIKYSTEATDTGGPF